MHSNANAIPCRTVANALRGKAIAPVCYSLAPQSLPFSPRPLHRCSEQINAYAIPRFSLLCPSGPKPVLSPRKSFLCFALAYRNNSIPPQADSLPFHCFSSPGTASPLLHHCPSRPCLSMPMQLASKLCRCPYRRCLPMPQQLLSLLSRCFCPKSSLRSRSYVV